MVVDKPAGWTSHDVVARCRRTFGQRRVGHSGTLDPDATGVLLVGLGRVTRLLRFLTELPKAYTGEVVLGIETSTLDSSGDVVATHDMSAVAPDEVQRAARPLVGEILQVPPMVSAVKVGGRRLHELARRGEEVERQARPVTVYDLEVTATDVSTVYRMDVRCSSGTYVRTLAADLGAGLGGGAHLRNLRRRAIGSFTEADAVALDEVGEDDVLGPAEAMRDYPAVTVGEDERRAVAHGRPLGGEASGPVRVLDGDGRLLAMYEPDHPGQLKAAVVLAAA